MKRVLFVLLIGFVSFGLQAQHVANKGDVFLNLGIGAPNYSYGLIPTINFSGEVAVIPTGDIGIVSFGGIAEIQFADYDHYYNNNKSKNGVIFLIGPRGTWHLQVFESDKWDVYGGAGFGIVVKDKYDNDEYKAHVGPYGEIFVGGRMMFSKGFGLFGELGGGTRSWAKFGVTFGL